MTNDAPTKKAEKPKKAPRAAKPLDTDRLARLAAEITEMLPTRRAELMHRLEVEEGMKTTFKDAACHVNLAGISASATAGEHDALTNWANAARRAVVGAA